MSTETKKVILVTGASRGIGKAILERMATPDVVAIGTATSAKGAEGITASLKEAGNEGCGMVVDISQRESIDAMFNDMVEKFGAPDILINNAGITRDNIILKMSNDEWDDVINTNLNSIFYLTQKCLKPMLKKRWGRVISMSSVSGITGNPGQANYSATKAAICAFSKSVAKEVSKRKITINAVAPGFIETDMIKELSEDYLSEMTRMIPSNRLGQPEEIASAVSFLASDEAAYITGQTLHVNGGMYMGS